MEPSLQLLYLQTGVYTPRLPDLLPLSIDSGDELAMLHHTVSWNNSQSDIDSDGVYHVNVNIRVRSIENRELCRQEAWRDIQNSQCQGRRTGPAGGVGVPQESKLS